MCCKLRLTPVVVPPTADPLRNKIHYPGDPVSETVRIKVARLDSLLFQAEEMIQTGISFDQRIKELKEIRSEIESGNPGRSDEGSDKSLNRYWQPASPAESGKLERLESQVSRLIRSMERDHYNLNRQVNDQIENLKQSIMLPVSTLVESFPLMVKDIAGRQDKIISLEITGEELEVDKRILEEFKDPLIHLIRNSIDHGISTPPERITQKKPPAGRITLTFIARENGIFEIILDDDGRGINTDRVLKSAVKLGYLQGESAEALSRDMIIPLIFKSGVTSSPIITDISGHGLGLSIVLEKVEKLNGKITVESAAGSGTVFHILLPVSLTTFRSLMIRSRNSSFMIPSANVERIIRVDTKDIKSAENRETIRIEGKIVRVTDLGEVLGLTDQKYAERRGGRGTPLKPGKVYLVLLKSGDNSIAFKVDEIMDERQILVKSLGKILKRVLNISGATVLGTGKIAPVLNVSDLMKSVMSSGGMVKSAGPDKHAPGKSRKVLVAEDSITARALFKNILENAGYLVTTATDGVDAFTRLRSGAFDLVVSDVDMPRMNGFELTSMIRKDKGITDTPVVLVTALESSEDKERGIEAGADAYIVKSSFDQDNLLDTIKKIL